MEVLIPMAMARLVKYGIEGGDAGAIYRYGFLMMAMAMLSLVFGSVCAHTASHASTGFAANLRDGMYRNIQRFSFANIDKYSTARFGHAHDNRRDQRSKCLPDDYAHCGSFAADADFL